MKCISRFLALAVIGISASVSLSQAGSVNFFDSNNATHDNVSIPVACVAQSVAYADGYNGYSADTTVYVIRKFSGGLLYTIRAVAPSYSSNSVQQPPTASQAGDYLIYHFMSGNGAHWASTDISW